MKRKFVWLKHYQNTLRLCPSHRFFILFQRLEPGCHWKVGHMAKAKLCLNLIPLKKWMWHDMYSAIIRVKTRPRFQLAGNCVCKSRNLKGEIGPFLTHVNTMGRWPFWQSCMEVTFCTSKLGAIISHDPCKLLLLHVILHDNLNVRVIQVHASKATHA